MDVAKRGELIVRRRQAKASLTKIDKCHRVRKNPGLIEEIQVRFERSPVICEKYDDMQIELEINDKAGGHEEDREVFEALFYNVKARMSHLIDARIHASSPPLHKSVSSSCLQ
jgi:hypothetical protein